jgi:hypothetical protein
MDAILTHTGKVPVAEQPRQRIRGVKRAWRLFAAVALTVADRLTLPHRDLPPEFDRFPPL